MIRKWQGEMMEKGFQPTYLKTIHNQLGAILNYAVNFYDLRSNPFKMIVKKVAAETKDMKSAVVPVANLFGGEEYVKVKKSDWNKILDALSKAVSRNHLLEKYEKKVSGLEKKVAVLTIR